MSFFKTTKNGKCDVTVTLFTSNMTMLIQRSSTFDVKPTIKELKQYYKKYKEEGAKYIRITTTPSCNVKTMLL